MTEKDIVVWSGKILEDPIDHGVIDEDSVCPRLGHSCIVRNITENVTMQKIEMISNSYTLLVKKETGVWAILNS